MNTHTTHRTLLTFAAVVALTTLCACGTARSPVAGAAADPADRVVAATQPDSAGDLVEVLVTATRLPAEDLPEVLVVAPRLPGPADGQLPEVVVQASRRRPSEGRRPTAKPALLLC